MFTPELAQGTKLKLYVGTTEKQKVVVDFGASISHMELDPHEAEKIAEMLLKHARIAKVPILRG